MPDPEAMISDSVCNCILHRYIWRPLFRGLCMVAVGRKDLKHWDNADGDEWGKHVKVIISRFKYGNIIAGLILATAAVLLSSQPPLASFMAYDIPAAYILTVVAFGAALLSVIYGAIVLVTYESCTAHKDMDRLKYTPPWQQICLLVWMAGPSFYYMAVSTMSLLLSVLIACFSSEYYIMKFMAALGTFSILVCGIVTIGVGVFMDNLKWSGSAARNKHSASGTGASSTLVDEEAGYLLPSKQDIRSIRLGDVRVLGASRIFTI